MFKMSYEILYKCKALSPLTYVVRGNNLFVEGGINFLTHMYRHIRKTRENKELVASLLSPQKKSPHPLAIGVNIRGEHTDECDRSPWKEELCFISEKLS